MKTFTLILIFCLTGCVSHIDTNMPANLNPSAPQSRAVITSKAEPQTVIEAPQFVTHIIWNQTGIVSADLRFNVYESSNLVNWDFVATTYCLSAYATSSMPYHFYRVSTFDN
jgi:hypothetical protein